MFKKYRHISLLASILHGRRPIFVRVIFASLYSYPLINFYQDPYLVQTDPDRRDPKTNESYGSGSGTLVPVTVMRCMLA